MSSRLPFLSSFVLPSFQLPTRHSHMAFLPSFTLNEKRTKSTVQNSFRRSDYTGLFTNPPPPWRSASVPSFRDEKESSGKDLSPGVVLREGMVIPTYLPFSPSFDSSNPIPPFPRTGL